MMAQGPLYFYGDCDEIEERGFVTCDIESVLDGASFNLPYVLDGGFGSGDFNDWLCTGGIWFSTWGWYGFIAGESDISIQVEFTNCINIGNEYGGFVILQQGCQGGECIAFDGGCDETSLDLNSSDLVVGELYFIHITICDEGAACDVDISLDHEAFELDDPLEISAYSVCKEECLTGDDCDAITSCTQSGLITVCPEELIRFSTRHLGNSSSDLGDNDEICSYYPEGYLGELTYEFDGQTYIVDLSDEDDSELILTMPDVDEFYSTQICLNELSTFCEIIQTDICLDINVVPIEPETLIYDVCIEDLKDGWLVPLDDDPNGDGIFWLGPKKFELGDLNNGDDDCLFFELFEPVCDCYLEQTLCIDVKDGTNATETVIYMFDSQFDEEGEYLWNWPNGERVFLYKDVANEIYVEESSLQFDYLMEYCDTSMFLFVETLELSGRLMTEECENPDSLLYFFQMELPEDGSPWPEINDGYNIDWINCSTGELIKDGGRGSRPESIAVENTIEICVQVDFDFINGVWGSEESRFLVEEVNLQKIFGPYELTNSCQDQKTCPTWSNLNIGIDGIEGINPNEPIDILKDQSVYINIEENILPHGGTIDWYYSEEKDFIPGEQGSLLGSSDIESNWWSCDSYVEFLAINYDEVLGGSEYFLIGTGTGLMVDELFIDLDDNCDSSCDPDCTTDLYGTQCPWVKGSQELVSGCANVILVGPGDNIPPNSILVVFIDNQDSIERYTNSLCSMEGCIYVLFNECERCLDAFDNISGSYRIDGCDFASEITYDQGQEFSYVTNTGTYGLGRDTLPDVEMSFTNIESEVENFQLDLNCTVHGQEVYVRGVINSELYNNNCCSPYTPTLQFNLECENNDTELVWTDTTQLPSDIIVTNNNCNEPYMFANGAFGNAGVSYTYPISSDLYASNCIGPINFSSSHTPDSEFEQGETLVTYYVNDGCGNELTHSFLIIVECESMPPIDGPQVEFPWLESLIDFNNCEGVAVTEYDLGPYSFLFVETNDSSVLYFEDGTEYCTATSTFNCLAFYNLTQPTSEWTCEDTGTGPAPGSEIFDDYPFLNDLVDEQNCGDAVIEFYQFGASLFPYVKVNGTEVLYSNTGQRYCESFLPDFDCIALYNLSAPVMTWQCDEECICPAVVNLVCGEDGNTYNNACLANCAGVTVVSEGSCPQSTDPIFVENEWLLDLVDPTNCEEGTTITVYQTSIFKYYFVESGGVTTMYNSAGTFYCQDGVNFSCAEAYGFTEGDIVDVWNCDPSPIVDGTIAVRTSKQDFDIKVYPNPVLDILTLEFNLLSDNTNIQVFDLEGKAIKLESRIISNSIIELDLTNVNSGMYMIRIENGNQTEIKRIIKI